MKFCSFFILICLFWIGNAKGQYRFRNHFKIDILMGVGIPQNKIQTTALDLSLEVHYLLSDKISLGLRSESFYTYEDFSSGDNTISIKYKSISTINSLCSTLDYYFANSSLLKPFISAGLGAYFLSTPETYINYYSGYGNSYSNNILFGAFPRIGLEIWHFRVVADYNLVASNQSYFSLKAGGFFGGGSQRRR